MTFDNHHGIRYLLNKELTEIYITHALRNFAHSMVGIFVPIYLLQSGLQLYQVFLFYIIAYSIEFFFFIFGSRFSSYMGIKHSILLSMPLIILFFVALYKIETLFSLLPLWLLFILLSSLFAAAMFLYWFSFHVDFAKFSDSENEGKQVGTLQAITTLFSVLGPLFGGLIITIFSFDLLFIIVSIILFAATIPLFMTEEIHTPKYTFTFKTFKTIDRRSRAVYLAEGARQVSALIVWPILLYIIAIQTSSMGLLYSITNLLLAIFSIFVGRFSDKVDRKHMMRIGAVTHGFSLTLRSLFTSFFAIFSLQSLGAISFPLLNIPYSSIVYTKARKYGVSTFIILRQSLFNLGRIMLMTVALLLVLLLPLPKIALIVPLMVGSICAIIMSFIAE
ncbi:MAG: hypothetical protein ACLFTR_01685 [Candidatus Woesearchaeota archaeon]